MRTLGFHGASDDLVEVTDFKTGRAIEEYGVSRGWPVLIDLYSPSTCEAVVVVLNWLEHCVWSVGLAHHETDVQLPEWARRVTFTIEKAGYSATLFLQLPDDISISLRTDEKDEDDDV